MMFIRFDNLRKIVGLLFYIQWPVTTYAFKLQYSISIQYLMCFNQKNNNPVVCFENDKINVTNDGY